jgi:hypothetical protein
VHVEASSDNATTIEPSNFKLNAYKDEWGSADASEDPTATVTVTLNDPTLANLDITVKLESEGLGSAKVGPLVLTYRIYGHGSSSE